MCLLNYFVSLDLPVPSHIISTDTGPSACWPVPCNNQQVLFKIMLQILEAPVFTCCRLNRL